MDPLSQPMPGVGPAYGVRAAVCAPAGVTPPGRTTAANRATAARALRMVSTSTCAAPLLPVHRAHVRVAVAGRGARRSYVIDPSEVVVGQLDVGSAEVLLEPTDPFGSRDGDD